MRNPSAEVSGQTANPDGFGANSPMVTFCARLPTVRRVGDRVVGVVAASIVMLAACSQSTTTGAPAGTTIGTTVGTTAAEPGATVSMTRPEFSFDDSVPPPRLVNTGTDYVAILKSLENYGSWLAAHRPDPALASNVLAGGTRLLVLFSRDLTRLRDNSRREIEQDQHPSRYTIVSTTPDAFSIRVDEGAQVHKVVDATGRVMSQLRSDSPATYLDLAVLSGGRWLLAAVDEQPRPTVEQ